MTILTEQTTAIYKFCKNTSNVSVHTTPEKFKNAAITGQFGFVFEKKHGLGNRMIM